MKTLKITISFLLTLFTLQPLFADQVAQTGRQFLLIPQDARGSGMGGSFAALSGGAMDIFSNPAALIGLRQEQLSLSHLSWFGGTNEESAAYARVIEGAGVIGGGLSFYWIPSFDNTGGVETAFSSNSYQGVLGYADRFGVKDLAFGASLRYVGMDLGGLENSVDLGLDLGLFYETEWKPLKLGAVIKNIDLLTNAKGNSAFLYGLGASFGDEERSLSLELDRIPDQDIQLQLGGEYWIEGVVAFRAGVKVQDSVDSFVQPSLGVGVRLGGNYCFDYAVANIGDLGVVQWITMGIFFGSPDGPVHPVNSKPAPGETKSSTFSPPPREESIPVVRHTKTTPKASKTIPAPTVTPTETGFSVQALVVDNTVNLSWRSQALAGSPDVSYNVYSSLVPGAGFQKVTDKPVAAVRWSGEIGLRGITYYFKVKVVGADGQETKSSEIKGVEIP